MKRIATLALRAGQVVLCTALLAGPAQAQRITQTFTLRPGWNAVYLELEPENNAPGVVFSNLPIASVWTWAERLTAVEFIQDPAEETFNRAGWLGWFPPGRPESFLSNLHAIQAHRSYLIKLNPGAPTVWSVTGRPVLRRPEWAPDAYNLRGFCVDEVDPPTFLSFFRAAKAHCNPANGALENIYRLNDSGQWTLVAPSDLMKRGEAYWVFSRGASDFAAPFEVRPQFGDSVDFDRAMEEFRIEVRNRTTAHRTVAVHLIAASATGVLAYRDFEPTNGGYVWPTLSTVHTVQVPAETTHTLRLAVRRGQFTAATYSAVLEIFDGAGTAHFVPVTAERETGAVGGGPFHPLQGLWVGSVGVSAVNEVNSANPTDPTKVPTEFPLRLLLHVDSSGQTRFLKEVIQMWRDGTYTNDASGSKVVDRPGEYVLLTDDRLIGQFKGATLRDGVPVGRRLSTAGFDFDGGQTNCLLMSGDFGIGKWLGLTIALGPNFPTNPFRHKYHPDHDNLDGRFKALTNNFEAYAVTREIELEFTDTDPTGESSPDYGYSVVGGIYTETLVGLHKNPIRLRGNFRLTRSCFIAELNPSPTL